MKERTVRLPYIDTLPTILLVLVINLAFGLLQAVRGVTHRAILVDALICGITTSFLCVFVSQLRIRLRAGRGELPPNAPAPGWVRRLPASPFWLSLLFAALFAAAAPLAAEMLLRFYRITEYTGPRFLLWKLVYSIVLSAKLTELAVLRLIQPDCLRPGDPPQTGSPAIKDPLPRFGAFAELFNTVTTDWGFNLFMGLLLGGTLVIDGCVVLPPTERSGILISGAILGLIVSARMVYPVAKQICGLRLAGALPPPIRRDAAVRLLPEAPAAFALALAPAVAVISAAALWLAFAFFGFERLDFFQYFVLRSLYVWLLTKPVVGLAVLRYMQAPPPGAETGKEPHDV